MQAIAQLYQRAFALARRWPWLLLGAAAAEFVQHVVEIRIGLYAGATGAATSGWRLGFGAVKVLAIFCTLLVAWRLWRFDGDSRRALTPSLLLLKGVAAFLLVQAAGELVSIGVGRGLVALAPTAPRPARIALALAPLLLWLLASAALFPWYVGLATEDRGMTLRRALGASRGHMPMTWGLILAGFLPVMIVHYALGYAAVRGAPAWPIMIVDTAVVVGLTATLAATYYTIYQRASERMPRPTG